MSYPRHLTAALIGLLLACAALAACAGGEVDDAANGTERPATDDPAEDAEQAEPAEDAEQAEPADGPADDEEVAQSGGDDPGAGEAPLDEIALTVTPVADADAPTAGAVAPDGTLYIAERAGLVRPLTDDGLGDPVLDLSGETTTDSERGLLGIVFAEGRLYASYTDSSGDSRLDAFEWDGGAADAGSRENLLTVEQPYGNHNGGDVTVGPDGMLWLSLGDGGGSGDPTGAGQDVSTPLGALLRLDPATGEAAPGNPFEEGDADARIWAYGLRNPWRFSFDADSGDLWVADVGEGDREEINRVPAGEGAGANFGWNLMEGTREFAGREPDDHRPPVHEYETSVDGCAITGGYVYRGSAVAGLQGAYLFSDFCEGGLRGLRHDGGTVTETIDFGVSGAGQVVSFAQDADGELYLLTFDDGVLRVDPS